MYVCVCVCDVTFEKKQKNKAHQRVACSGEKEKEGSIWEKDPSELGAVVFTRLLHCAALYRRRVWGRHRFEFHLALLLLVLSWHQTTHSILFKAYFLFPVQSFIVTSINLINYSMPA